MFYVATTAQAIGQTNPRYELRFPTHEQGMDQDQAWCELKLEGRWRQIRFHDYAAIYNIPGLYESLFYRRLRCNSPKKVVGMLSATLSEHREPIDRLRVLDVGAGNGMVGAELMDAGAQACVGIDIIEEAKSATERDRPWIYDSYHVADLTDLPEPTEKKLRSAKLNALVCVAALGFGDIPAEAFINAVNLIDSPGWLAFNVKEDFLKPDEDTGFSSLVHELSRQGVIRIEAYQRYQHRLSYAGDPLYYVAMVARKLKDVPDAFLEA